MANKIVVEDEEQKPEANDAKKSHAGFTSALRKVADFDFNISREWLIKQMPFGMFLVFLTLLHIWNAHYTERIIRKTQKMDKETKELRTEYISIFSALMNESKQSTISAKLDTIGIKELTTPPVKITISDK